MKFIALILFLVLIGCNQQKKTQRYLFSNPDFSAAYCAEQYPAKDSIIIKDSIKYDTALEITWWTDSVYVDTSTNTTVKIKYRDRVVTKTVRHDSIIYRSNTAEERRLQLSLQACQTNNNSLLENYNNVIADRDDWKGKARKRFWLLIFCAGAATMYAGFKIRKSFLT